MSIRQEVTLSAKPQDNYRVLTDQLQEVPSRVAAIGDTLAAVFAAAHRNGTPTGLEAERLARDRIAEVSDR